MSRHVWELYQIACCCKEMYSCMSRIAHEVFLVKVLKNFIEVLGAMSLWVIKALRAFLELKV